MAAALPVSAVLPPVEAGGDDGNEEPATPTNFRSWRLSKVEQKAIDDELQKFTPSASTKKEQNEEIAQKKLQLTIETQRKKAKASAAKVAAVALAGRPKAKAKAAATNASSAGSSGPNLNGEYHARVETDLQVILKVLGKDMMSKPANSITALADKDGGIQQPYDRDLAKLSLDKHSEYICGANLFWLDLYATPLPAVPLERKRVEEQADFYFQQGPQFLSKLFSVAVFDTDNLLAVPSSMRMLSPPEYIHSVLMGAAASLADDSSEANKQAWKNVFLSIPIKIHLTRPESMWVISFSLRQEITQSYKSLSLSALQQCIEIMEMKQRIEAMDHVDLSDNKALAAALQGKGLKAEKSKQKKKDDDEDCLSLRAVIIAKDVVDAILPCAPALLVVRKLEEDYGLKSCLNSMAALGHIAKVSRESDRVWVLHCLLDYIDQDFATNSSMSANSLKGTNKQQSGYISLFLLKRTILDYCLSVHFPTLGVTESDTTVMKRVLTSHSAYQQGTDPTHGNLSWQSQMSPSGLDAFKLAGSIVYTKSYDNSLRTMVSAKPEKVLSAIEPITEKMQVIKEKAQNEAVERMAAAKMANNEQAVAAEAGDDEEDVEMSELDQLRRPVHKLMENSAEYWKAVGNQTLRAYCNLQVAPGTPPNCTLQVEQVFQNVNVEHGKSCVLIWIDLETFQDNAGLEDPGRLKRNPLPDKDAMQDLIWGAMAALNGQVQSFTTGQVSKPAEGCIVAVHQHCVQPFLQKRKEELQKLFRGPKTKEPFIDCCEKVLSVTWEEESIRERKRRIKGGSSYHSVSQINFYSHSDLISDCLPEKKRHHYKGYNVADAVGFVEAVPSTKLLRRSRKVKAEILGGTANIRKLDSGVEDWTLMESVFPGAMLPVEFFSDILQSYNVKGVVDCSPGQGELAKAAVMARTLYLGFCASDMHCQTLEVLLSEFVLEKMSDSECSLYRPEYAKCQGSASAPGKKDEATSVKVSMGLFS